MHAILIVIAVSNGRYYHEEPKYAVVYPDMEACQVVASTYPKVGVEFNRAICVPQKQVPNKEDLK